MATTAIPVKEDKTIVSPAENQTGKISIEKIGLTAGVITCAALVTYFMIMKYLVFIHSEIAWGLNTIILWAGIMLAYRYYRSKTKLNVDYIPGLILGIATTAASVIPFVLFVYIWFSQADGMLLQLKNNALFMGGEQITPVKAAASTMIEGMCSGVIISFMMMQYFKSGFRRTGKEKLMEG